MVVDGYIRVSRVGRRTGPRFISPAIQREAIQRWAQRQGFKLAEVFEELDESGARADRPLLERAIQRVEARATDGMVVWKVDRFGRSLLDGLTHVGRVRAAGGTFFSVQDGLDTGTDAGRLVMRVLLSVAEFQREGIRTNWELACERAIRRGVYAQPFVPVGYIKTRSGLLRPDPRTGPLITEVYDRRAQGASWSTLARHLEANGVLTARGNPGWTGSRLSRALSSRVYLGEVTWGLFINESAHPSLTDSATWHAARGPRLVRQHESHPALLARLARCSNCGSMLSRSWTRLHERPFLNYTCSRFSATGPCPAPACIGASKLDPYVLDAVMYLLDCRRRRPEKMLVAAEARATEAAAALTRYRDNDQVARSLGPDGFAEGIDVRQARVAAANLDVMDMRARSRVHDLPPVDEIRMALPEMTFDDRRLLVSKVIDVVFVAHGKGPASERVTICPAGTAPRGLPRATPTKQKVRDFPLAPRREWLNPLSVGSLPSQHDAAAPEC